MFLPNICTILNVPQLPINENGFIEMTKSQLHQIVESFPEGSPVVVSKNVTQSIEEALEVNLNLVGGLQEEEQNHKSEETVEDDPVPIAKGPFNETWTQPKKQVPTASEEEE